MYIKEVLSKEKQAYYYILVVKGVDGVKVETFIKENLARVMANNGVKFYSWSVSREK